MQSAHERVGVQSARERMERLQSQYVALFFHWPVSGTQCEYFAEQATEDLAVICGARWGWLQMAESEAEKAAREKQERAAANAAKKLGKIAKENAKKKGGGR